MNQTVFQIQEGYKSILQDLPVYIALDLKYNLLHNPNLNIYSDEIYTNLFLENFKVLCKEYLSLYADDPITYEQTIVQSLLSNINESLLTYIRQRTYQVYEFEK
jgi:hypothetical protein